MGLERVLSVGTGRELGCKLAAEGVLCLLWGEPGLAVLGGWSLGQFQNGMGRVLSGEGRWEFG